MRSSTPAVATGLRNGQDLILAPPKPPESPGTPPDLAAASQGALSGNMASYAPRHPGRYNGRQL